MSGREQFMAEFQRPGDRLINELSDEDSHVGTLRTEDVLRSEKQFIDMALDAQLDTFFLFEPASGKALRWNRAFREISGYTDEEIARLSAPDSYYAPEGLERAKVFVERVMQQGAGTIELELICKDGRQVPTEYRVSVINDDQGNPKYVISIGRDITERKRAEEEKLAFERQVQQAQKLESLGVLAGGIAHDFNNLLVGILGNAELALMHLPSESPVGEIIKKMVDASTRAADLAKQMLAYSGKGMFVIESLDLEKLVVEMQPLLKTMIPKKATVNFDFAKNVPAIEADVDQIRQIIINLVTNAAEAIGENSGRISIRTGTMECDRYYLDETYLDNDLPEGEYAYLEVFDSGCGMDRNTVGKIFDPFFSTKFASRGLGLAVVLGIVRGHRGAIKVYSEPGRGTTFKVLFPIVRIREPLIAPPVKDFSDESLKGKRVLLVDDEETVRSVGRMILDLFGVEVVTANNGKQALELFEKEPDDFDCVLLDLTMPLLDGEETFREMQRVKKDVCVILSSGYDRQDLISRFAGRGLAGFIQKPYGPTKLREALLAALSKC
jgi:PAS domain S-box-containing protein